MKFKNVIYIGNVTLVSLVGMQSVKAEHNITFKDITAGGESGIDYSRKASPRLSILEEIQRRGFMFPEDGFNNPLKPHGAPGVAVLDYDNDGDDDIYVTNGPGRANSLYSNQFIETGMVKFVDVAKQTGTELKQADSTGICYGDIDNDGDQDLLVLSAAQGNTLLENRKGKFRNISSSAKIGGVGKYSTSCAMGDVNNDGLIDIVIGNTYDNWDNYGPIVSFDEAFRNQDNQLFVNQGGKRFVDKSFESGITNYQGISWALSLVDYDEDGDVDLIVADDQGAKPGAIRGGFDTGYVRIYKNNGSGYFKDVTEVSGTNRFGAWMGLTFADYNSDGHMDIFASNIGDYFAQLFSAIVPFDVPLGDWNAGWFLGGEEGQFSFPNVGDLGATPFGWGAIAVDYDNDADTDIVYHGGIDNGAFVDGTNPGAVLENDGNANFSYDSNALANSTDHVRRSVMGLATGDFNNDGFADMASVSSQNWPESFPVFPIISTPIGAFDAVASIWPTSIPNDPTDLLQGFTWSGLTQEEGSLVVELNSANNYNNWVKVDVVGSKGIVKKASVNRDGIGAVLKFTPRRGKTAMLPVTAGSSYASQNGRAKIFGMGRHSRRGTLDITWPGGVKNRLYGVKASEHITFHEIPCSYDDASKGFKKYRKCVKKSLKQLVAKGAIKKREKRRIYSSAIKAYRASH